jgi:capsular exopolysaccharide synthesis family protein
MNQQTSPNPEFNLREYWQMLLRRRWMILMCVVVSSLAAAISSWVKVPVFQSTCKLLIERQGVRVLKQELGSSEPSWIDYQNFYNTQHQIIGSERVLRTAIDKLHLLDLDPSQYLGASGAEPSQFGKTLAEFKRFITRAPSPLEGQPDPYRPWLKLLSGGLTVVPIRESHLVDISFVHSDREFAAKAANAVADAYITFTLSDKSDKAEKLGGFFNTQIEEYKQEIQRLQRDLNQYAQQHGIVAGDSTEATIQNLDSLRQSKTEAEMQLGRRRARLQSMRSSSAESLEEVRQSAVVADLTRRITEAESRLSSLRATLGTEAREVRETQGDLESARQARGQEIDSIAKRAIDSANREYEQSVREVAELDRLYQQAATRVGQFKDDVVIFVEQRATIEQKKRALDDLLQKQAEVSLAGSLGDSNNNVRLIQEATPSEIIFRPKKTLNVMLGLLFGLFLGVASAVLIEYLDNTIKSPDDLRQHLGIAMLGMIPAQAAPARNKPDKTAGPAPAAPNVDPALVTLHQPLSPVSESYRELRTAVLLATAGHPPRDLCITSCQPSEGKTTTSINLAIALAQLGRRVLLVDTDLRRPRCHHVLRVSASRGVSTFLTGLSDIQTLIQNTNIESLSVIPAGPIPPNPAELLDSDRFKELVLALRARTDFDHVIYDSPPALSVVDPLLIGRHTDGTILVLKAGFTSKDAGKLGRDKLLSGRVTLLGAVLNAVEIDHIPYQYRYYRYEYALESEVAGEQPRRSGKSSSTSA